MLFVACQNEKVIIRIIVFDLTYEYYTIHRLITLTYSNPEKMVHILRNKYRLG